MKPKTYILAGLKFYLKYSNHSTIPDSIQQKVREYSKTGQGYKNLIFNFWDFFLTAFVKVYFLRGRQRAELGLHSSIS